MKIYPLLLLLAMLPFFGHTQGTVNGSITHDGLKRTYLLYVPASNDASKPSTLVLCYHGYGSSASTIWFYSGFNKIADTANFLIAYPQGTVLPGGENHWNVGGWTVNSTTDDLGFTEALLDSIAADYAIDEKRIYATGMSNGGFMSFVLACQLSERIAAVASVTGSMTPETYDACDPQRPVPVLQMHGTADATVPYAGDATKKSIDDVLAYWVNNNQTNTIARRDSIPNTNTGDGSTAEKLWYAAGDNCSSVTHYRITGGGHDWPGAFGNLDISASAVVWNFLSQYDIDGKITCDSEGEDAVLSTKKKVVSHNLKVYPNPSSTYITLAGEHLTSGAYEVRSVEGKLVLKGIVKADDQRIDIAKLKAGIYMLNIGQQFVKIIKED